MRIKLILKCLVLRIMLYIPKALCKKLALLFAVWNKVSFAHSLQNQGKTCNTDLSFFLSLTHTTGPHPVLVPIDVIKSATN